MDDPAELASGLFAVVVMCVVTFMLFKAFRGEDISPIAQTVSDWAIPFVGFILILLVISELLF